MKEIQGINFGLSWARAQVSKGLSYQKSAAYIYNTT